MHIISQLPDRLEISFCTFFKSLFHAQYEIQLVSISWDDLDGEEKQHSADKSSFENMSNTLKNGVKSLVPTFTFYTHVKRNSG